MSRVSGLERRVAQVVDVRAKHMAEVSQHPGDTVDAVEFQKKSNVCQVALEERQKVDQTVAGGHDGNLGLEGARRTVSGTSKLKLIFQFVTVFRSFFPSHQ